MRDLIATGLLGLIAAMPLASCGDDANTIVDAASVDARAADARPVDAAADREGVVDLSETWSSSTQPSAGIATATFTAAGSLLPTPIATIGGCDVFRVAGGGAVTLSAGVITVSGASSPITLSPSGSPPSYAPALVFPPTVLFADRAALMVTAAGGDIPAFSGELTAPAHPTGVVFPAVISRAGAVHVTWTPDASGGAVEIEVRAFMSGGQSIDQIICRPATDTGSFTVPAEAMAMLSAADNTGAAYVGRERTTSVVAGSASVRLVASQRQLSRFTP